MSRLTWDDVGQRFYETGVNQGVLYLPNSAGAYVDGVAWNGLTSVSESPSGAEPNAQYADNIKYLNLYSAEEFAATLEAFTYPREFKQFDGLATPTPGVNIGQQTRRMFGLSYRTLKGNDVDGSDHGYIIHLVYGCQASPSEKAYSTVNDSPEPITFSWSIATTPVQVSNLKPTSIITIDSTEVDNAQLQDLEQILYGAPGVNPFLPLPDQVISMFSGGGATQVAPVKPAFNSATNTITIPSPTGMDYYIADVIVPPGDIIITEDTFVDARPKPGYIFTVPSDNDWLFEHTP